MGLHARCDYTERTAREPHLNSGGESGIETPHDRSRRKRERTEKDTYGRQDKQHRARRRVELPACHLIQPMEMDRVCSLKDIHDLGQVVQKSPLAQILGFSLC